jgi:D-lactate dehydrogenase
MVQNGGAAMKIMFYDTKKYDKDSFERTLPEFEGITMEYLDTDLSAKTAALAKGYDAVCAFVSSDVGRDVIAALADVGVRLILMRCAGYNNVDEDAAKEYHMTVLRVPGYSPEAVAEHAMALALAVNRHLHKGYIKVRENNFSLTGLTGINFYQKTAGIVGTGKIGKAMARICRGFGMNIIACDAYPDPTLDFVTYVDFDTLLKESDLISLHCPLTDETYHLICKENIEKMKDNVILVNTSRGALIKTDDLIAGIRSMKFFGVGLDVYEEEKNNVFENREDDILETSITSRLLSFPNVIVTSHQGFLTEEALAAISRTTLQNALDFENGCIKEENVVVKG